MEWALCTTQSHGTKLYILVSKLRSGTTKTMQLVPVHLDLPLFCKSHWASCSPVYIILYHVTGSCKGPIERLVCITGIYAQNDPGNPRWITMLRPFMRAFINDVVLMENTVMQSNLIYTIMRPPFLTNGKFLFDKPPMQTFLVLVTRSFQRTFVGENCVTSAWEATL